MKFLFLLSFCLLPVCNGQSVLDIRPPAKSVHSLSNAYRQQQREEAQKQRDAIKAGEARLAHLRILNAEEKSRQDRRKHFLARKAALQSPEQAVSLPEDTATRAGNVIESSDIAPSVAGRSPVEFVLLGWQDFNHLRVPQPAILLLTNAPRMTIFTRNDAGDWNCWTTVTNCQAGEVREFGWCPGRRDAALFKVVLHD